MLRAIALSLLFIALSLLVGVTVAAIVATGRADGVGDVLRKIIQPAEESAEVPPPPPYSRGDGRADAYRDERRWRPPVDERLEARLNALAAQMEYTSQRLAVLQSQARAEELRSRAAWVRDFISNTLVTAIFTLIGIVTPFIIERRRKAREPKPHDTCGCGHSK